MSRTNHHTKKRRSQIRERAGNCIDCPSGWKKFRRRHGKAAAKLAVKQGKEPDREYKDHCWEYF